MPGVYKCHMHHSRAKILRKIWCLDSFKERALTFKIFKYSIEIGDFVYMQFSFVQERREETHFLYIRLAIMTLR